MRVLLIEDNELVSEFVRAGFQNAGWLVDAAPGCQAAARYLEQERYDVMVLDIELPDGDGFTLLEDVRSRPGYLPVIMLTARSGPDAAVKGLGAGADDYVTKPFDITELIARVLTVLRRSGNGAQQLLQFGDLSFNRLTREATCSDRRVRLTPKEQTFLEQLMLKPGAPVSREELLRKVWRIHFDPGSNLIDAHVARLRQKLKTAASRVAIVTHRAAGFSLEAAAADSA